MRKGEFSAEFLIAIVALILLVIVVGILAFKFVLPKLLLTIGNIFG